MSAGRPTIFLVTVIAAALGGVARAQLTSRPGVGATSPNALNQQSETLEQIRQMEDQRRADDRARRRIEKALQADGHAGGPGQPLPPQVQIKNFMDAIKPRRQRFADFDKVVLQSNTPLTQSMLAVITASPYAADMAYYLGKHRDEAGAIAQLPPPEGGEAMKQIEGSMAVRDAVRR